MDNTVLMMTALVLWGGLASLAAEAGEPPSSTLEIAKIRDNLFLLEEAYNQEPGVIQHIQTMLYNPRPRSWSYGFTEEWPVPDDRNQLSVTVPVSNGGEGEKTALNDVLLNFRHQVLGVGGEGKVAFAPRLSLAMPTGDYRDASGRGVFGLQLNAPFSIELGDHFVTHLNAGVTLTPGARSPGGRGELAVDTNVGAALVWLLEPWVNPLVEVSYLTTEEVLDEGSDRESMVVVNPGVRFAIDFKSGLQIVPGISVPIEFGEDRVEVGALFYLSFEHPVWTPAKPESEGR